MIKQNNCPIDKSDLPKSGLDWTTDSVSSEWCSSGDQAEFFTCSKD